MGTFILLHFPPKFCVCVLPPDVCIYSCVTLLSPSTMLRARGQRRCLFCSLICPQHLGSAWHIADTLVNISWQTNEQIGLDVG